MLRHSVSYLLLQSVLVSKPGQICYFLNSDCKLQKNFYFYYNTLSFIISNFDKIVCKWWVIFCIWLMHNNEFFFSNSDKGIAELHKLIEMHHLPIILILSVVWYCDFKSSFSVSSHRGKSSISFNLWIDPTRIRAHFPISCSMVMEYLSVMMKLLFLISFSHLSIPMPMQNALQWLSDAFKNFHGVNAKWTE